MRLMIVSIVISCFASIANAAPIEVITTVPEIAWVVSRIGGAEVHVKSLLKGTENPHYVDAVPEFVRLVAEADLVCMVGMDLEIGWMPRVLSRSGNAKVQSGGLGYCEVGTAISPLEKPASSVDRSMGDIHPQGNPHFWLSPAALKESARYIAKRLTDLRADKATTFQTALVALEKELTTIQEVGQKKLASFGKVAVIEYHKEFSYFFHAYGIESLGSIEEKPGVAPSSGRIAEVAMLASGQKARLALAASYSPKKVMQRFSEISKVPYLQVRTSMSLEEGGFPALQKQLIDAFAGQLAKPSAEK